MVEVKSELPTGKLRGKYLYRSRVYPQHIRPGLTLVQPEVLPCVYLLGWREVLEVTNYMSLDKDMTRVFLEEYHPTVSHQSSQSIQSHYHSHTLEYLCGEFELVGTRH
jgi:hypothetical protein